MPATPVETAAGPEPAETPTVRMSPQAVMERWRPGSEGDQWTWADEERSLWSEPMIDHTLTVQAEIVADGILEPVLAGDDGRLWDGHHRVLIAARLGIGEIDVCGPGITRQPTVSEPTAECPTCGQPHSGSGLQEPAGWSGCPTCGWCA